MTLKEPWLNKMKFLFFILLLLSYATSFAEEIGLDIQQINSFFNNQGVADKVPFNLNQLESFYIKLNKPKGDAAIKLTKKYLSLSYPKGYVYIVDVINSKLPSTSKVLILKASKQSLLLSANLDDLWQMPLEYLNSIQLNSIKAEGLNIASNSIQNKVLDHNHNLSYSAYVRMHDSSGEEYLLSTPSEQHAVSEVLSKVGNSFQISFISDQCTEKQCVTKNINGIFSSFKFSAIQLSQLSSGNNVVAECGYENIYRREYQNHSVIEVSYNNCRLVSIDGKAPEKLSPLLKRIYSNE